ncbi:Mucin-5B [Tyrophagus putrescentiae]|nr:Mucin-5B [Tyrophagus putrescentiae]
MNSRNLLPVLAVVAAVLFSSAANAASILECPPHSTFNGCMSRCPKTCQNIDLPPTNCISACSVGCECLEGFVKVAKGATSQCVKSYECPMYTKQATLPYPVLRKLAAAASVPANQASLLGSLNPTTLAMAGGMVSTGSIAGSGSQRPTTAAMAILGGHRTTASASASASTIAVLRKVKQARPEENESHED